MVVSLITQEFKGLKYTAPERIELSSRETTIGRSKRCDITIHDPEKIISGHHCTITVVDNTVTLIDYSSNGVAVNEHVLPVGIVARTQLNHGDRVQLGDYTLLVSISNDAQNNATLLTPETELARYIGHIGEEYSSHTEPHALAFRHEDTLSRVLDYLSAEQIGRVLETARSANTQDQTAISNSEKKALLRERIVTEITGTER